MAKEGSSCSQPTRPARFAKNIVPQILYDGTVEIPANLVNVYGASLSNYAFFESSAKRRCKVELKHCDGRVLLDKGWQAFLHSHSIVSGYSLIFKYEGESLFRVSVFDPSGSEIHYHHIDEDSDDDDHSSVEILDEWPHKTRHSSVTNVSDDDDEDEDEVVQEKGIRICKRGMDFESGYMHFCVVVQAANRCNLEIPESRVSGYFHGRSEDERVIHFDGPDGRCWSMKYSIGAPPVFQVSIGSEWRDFVQEYSLKDGDECNFELINRKVLAFNLTILRFLDDTGDEREGVAAETPAFERRKVSESPAFERAKSIITIWPSFTAKFKLYCTNKSHYIYMLSIPKAHAVAYLLGKNGDQVILRMAGRQNERTWSVKCYVKCYEHRNIVTARLSTGWKEFVYANEMQDGDACLFELLSMDPNCYQVTIVRHDESAN